MYEDFFAERLASLREQKRVSAREMSLAIGQNESYINRIENKKAFPSMQGFFYICEFLGVTPEEFFSTTNETPAALRELLRDLQKLSPDQLAHIAALVKGLQKESR